MTKDEIVSSITVDGKKWELGYANFFSDFINDAKRNPEDDDGSDRDGVFVTIHLSQPDMWKALPNNTRLAVWSWSGNSKYKLLYESISKEPEGDPTWADRPQEVTLSGVRLLYLPILTGAGGPAGNVVLDKLFLVKNGRIYEVKIFDASDRSEINATLGKRILGPKESVYRPDGWMRFRQDGFKCPIIGNNDKWNATGYVSGKFILKGDIHNPETLSIDIDTATLQRVYSHSSEWPPKD